MVFDTDSLKILNVNMAAISFYGYSRDEFRNMLFDDICIRDQKDRERSNGWKTQDISRHRKKNGSIAIVEISGCDIYANGATRRITIVNDITEHKKSEEALRFTQFAIDHTVMGIVWMGKNGRILYVNEAAHRLIGYTQEELLGMTVHEINPDYPKMSWEKTWQIVKRRGSVNAETWYRKKNGKLFPIELTANYMEYNKEEYICAMFHDVGDRKRTREILKKREEDLRIESNRLAEANTALKVLLKYREDDKKELEERFLSNIRSLIIPYVEKIKGGRLDAQQLSCMDILETNLNDILSPFLQKMSLRFSNFTPTEIQVANLIKVGKTTKEISSLLKVSSGTVDTHRNNIRSKLGLNKKKVNLRAYLLSLA